MKKMLFFVPLFTFAAITQKIELGYFGTTGNSNSNSITAAYSLTYQYSPKIKYTLFTDILYASKESATTNERYRINFDTYYYYTQKLYFYIQLDFLRNTFEGYNQQYSIGPGFGYNVYKGEKNSIDCLAGYEFRRNNYTTQPHTNYHYFKAQIKYKLQLTGKNSLDSSLDIVENLEKSRDYEMEFTTNLNLSIVNRLGLKLSFELDYDNLPPIGKKKTDTTTKASIVYSF